MENHHLLIDKDGKETAIFSGDTLFIGDVGDLI
jgi:glyoxylase-like metal-dependent hydrolase (beta-lactamase superfamily II)